MSSRICSGCRRHHKVCLCDALIEQSSPFKILFVQDFREESVSISTAWPAHKCLANSDFISVDAENMEAFDSKLQACLQGKEASVLFPADNSVELGPDHRLGREHVLVIVDGTWSRARKIVTTSKVLQGLPSLKLPEGLQSEYRVRKVPHPDCLSTIEAVAAAIDIEGGAQKTAGVLRSVLKRIVSIEESFRPLKHLRN